MTAMILLSEWERSQIEFWMPITGFQGYDVSTKGRVRTWRRRIGNQYKIGDTPHLIAQHLSKDKYPRVSLFVPDNKRHQKTVPVHLLMARTFLVNPNNLPQVNHLNGRKVDNYLWNFEWATQSRQAQHAYDIGLNTPRMGILNGNGVLTDDAVRDIRRTAFRCPKVGNGQELADRYGVSRTAINRVARGISYRNVS